MAAVKRKFVALKRAVLKYFEDNPLGLVGNVDEQPRYHFATDKQKVEAFDNWLQEQIDAGYEELATQEEQLELGSQLAQNASSISSISEDGTTALGAVQFQDDVLTLSQEDKDAVMDTIGSAPLDGMDVYFSSDIATSVEGLLGVGEVVGGLVGATVGALVGARVGAAVIGAQSG